MIEPPESLTKVLNYMVANSTTTAPDDFIVVLGPQAKVYKGNRSDIADGSGVKLSAVYDAIVTLTNLAVVQQLKKSSRHGPSIFWIIRSSIPTEKYSEYVTRNTVGASVSHPTKWSRMQDALNRINDRLMALETEVERLKHATKDNEVFSSILSGRTGD